MAQPGTVAGSDGAAAAPAMVPVWDPLVRVFHWSLVAAFAIAWLTDGDHKVHHVAGYAVLGLIGFRLVWGFVGSRHARFADFVPSPGALRAYLADLRRGRPRRHLGHNPAGGVMILAMLALLTAIGVTGWLQTTTAFWGVDWVEELHEALAWTGLGLVALHVAGVALSSLLHRENLVRAMVTGRKPACAGS